MQPRSSIAKSTGFFSLVSIVTGANPQDVAVCFASPIVTICRYPRVIPNHLPQDLATAFPTGNLPVRVCDLFAVLLRVAGFFLRILPGGWWLQPGPAWSSGLIVRLCPCPSPGWLLSFFLVSRFFPATSGISRGSESIRYPLVRSEEEFLCLFIPRAVPGRQAHIALILLVYLRD